MAFDVEDFKSKRERCRTGLLEALEDLQGHAEKIKISLEVDQELVESVYSYTDLQDVFGKIIINLAALAVMDEVIGDTKETGSG